jgi:hypothetical protein
MTRRQALALGSPPLAGLLFFATAFVVGKIQDRAVDRGVRLLDRLRL